MPAELKILDRDAPPLKQTLVQEREKLLQEAEIARSLLQAWGLVGVPNGEDAAGRATFRPLEPAELVARAMSVTRIFMDQVRREGWIIPLPPIADITADDTRRTGF